MCASSDDEWSDPIRTGRVIAGPNAGFAVQVVVDPRGFGFHMFWLQPGHRPGMQAYDDWMDDLNDVDELLEARGNLVEWDDA